MFEMILLALLVAKIRKYKLTPLFKEWAIYPILIFTSIYIVLQLSWFQGNFSALKYQKIFQVLYIGTLGILIIRCRLYKAGFIGVACVSVCGILNGIVMKANGGKMPVFPTFSYVTGYLKPDSFEKAAGYDAIHVMGNPSTRLSFLSDTIDIGYSVLSVGDIFIYLMMFIIIYGAIKCLNKAGR